MRIRIRGDCEVSLPDLLSDAHPGDAAQMQERDPPVAEVEYTFVWEEPDPDDQETVVTLTFEQLGENTKLSLDQGPFKTDARYELHEGGWTETLDRLEKSLARSG